MMEHRPHRVLLAELERRNVFRTSAVYGAASFVILEALRLSKGPIGVSPEAVDILAILALMAYPVALVLAWRFELTGAGVDRTGDSTSGELREHIARPRARRWAPLLLGVVGALLLGAAVWQVLSDAPVPF